MGAPQEATSPLLPPAGGVPVPGPGLARGAAAPAQAALHPLRPQRDLLRGPGAAEQVRRAPRGGPEPPGHDLGLFGAVPPGSLQAAALTADAKIRAVGSSFQGPGREAAKSGSGFAPCLGSTPLPAGPKGCRSRRRATAKKATALPASSPSTRTPASSRTPACACSPCSTPSSSPSPKPTASGG